MDNLKEYIEKFSKIICTVTAKEETFASIKEYFTENPINKNGLLGRVWILIGKNEKQEYVSLMVAQSENIQDEIIHDVSAMFNLEYAKQKTEQKAWSLDKEVKYNLDVIMAPQISEINSNDNSYLYQKNHSKIKKQYLYRYLWKKYKELKIYEVNIDSYLEIKLSDEFDENVKNVYELGKDYYAESKLAVETNSLFWNYYKSGVGKRAYYYFRNKD